MVGTCNILKKRINLIVLWVSALKVLYHNAASKFYPLNELLKLIVCACVLYSRDNLNTNIAGIEHRQ